MNKQQERGAMSNQDTTPKMHKWVLISRLFDLMYLFFSFWYYPHKKAIVRRVGWLVG